MITNRGHKKNRLESNEVVKILSNQVTKLGNSSTKKILPHIFNEQLHQYVSFEPWTPCHYHTWLEKILDKSARKFMPISRIKWTSGGNLVPLLQRVKRYHNGIIICIICNVEIYPDCFKNFHGIGTSGCLKYIKYKRKYSDYLEYAKTQKIFTIFPP